MATHSSILACEIPWTEEPNGLQSMGSPRGRRHKRLSRHAQRERENPGWRKHQSWGSRSNRTRGLRKLSPGGKSTLPERGYPLQLMHVDSCKPAWSQGKEQHPWDPASLPSPASVLPAQRALRDPSSGSLDLRVPPPTRLHPSNTHTLCPGTSGQSPQPSPTLPTHLWTPGRP